MIDAAQAEAARAKLAAAECALIKVGSATLTASGRGLALDAIADWCAQILSQIERGRRLALVSSGAVAEGRARLGWGEAPADLPGLQAAAAVGQAGLVGAYESAFAQHGRRTALVLLTHEDLADRNRYLNARSTLTRLMDLGIVPIVNENDTVATEEMRFGDNDTLAAEVASLLSADLLILLTDVDGLHEQDPHRQSGAPVIRHAAAEDPRLEALAGPGGRLGRGGMVTKVRAARIAARSGAHTVIANGRRPQVLQRIFSGAEEGTLLAASLPPLLARKRWIAGLRRPPGELVLDSGAARALRASGCSLLPVGVTALRGEFRRGEAVLCVTESGEAVAQGLVNYASDEASRILGLDSGQIQKALGYAREPELLHRDNLVLI